MKWWLVFKNTNTYVCCETVDEWYIQLQVMRWLCTQILLLWADWTVFSQVTPAEQQLIFQVDEVKNRPRGQPMPGRLLARMRSQVGCSRTVTPAHYIFQIFSSSLRDYRPVTLTSVISKCFERLVLGHLKSWSSQIGMRSRIEMRYKSYLRGAHITTSPWTFKKQRKSLI